jgi:hypothetical protein
MIQRRSSAGGTAFKNVKKAVKAAGKALEKTKQSGK